MFGTIQREFVWRIDLAYQASSRAIVRDFQRLKSSASLSQNCKLVEVCLSRSGELVRVLLPGGLVTVDLGVESLDG